MASDVASVSRLHDETRAKLARRVFDHATSHELFAPVRQSRHFRPAEADACTPVPPRHLLRVKGRLRMRAIWEPMVAQWVFAIEEEGLSLPHMACRFAPFHAVIFQPGDWIDEVMREPAVVVSAPLLVGGGL